MLLRYIIPLAIIISACGKVNEPSVHYTIHDKKVNVQYNNIGTLSFAALSHDVINIRYTDSLTYSDRDYAPQAISYIDLHVEEQDSVIVVTTDYIGLLYDMRDGSISLRDEEGNAKLIIKNAFERKGDSTYITLDLKASEAMYGTGSRALPLNRRGYRLQNYNKAHYAYAMGSELLNYSIPHVMSSEDYMVLFDNPARSFLDIGKSHPNELTFSSLGGNMSYYLINGSTPKELISTYCQLTGTQPLPPIWTFGNLQSRFGYRNQAQAEKLLDQSLKAGYPVDAMVLDIYWFGPELQDGQMGKLDWDTEQWPQPTEMISNFKQKEVNTILVTEPFFTLKSGRFEYLEQQGFLAKDPSGKAMQIPYFYFGNTGLLDIFNPKAKDWVWGEYKRLKDYGVNGWWVDLGEPEVHPDSIIHINGMGQEVHGAYGHEWAKMLTEGFERDFPNERLFHMGRAGFAGSQRYNLIPWSGDVSRTWSGLKAQLPIMLSMGVSGLAYMHSDAGGFSNVATSNPELYTRWLQYAVFTPVFRPHADEVVAPEPVTWPKEVQEKVMPAIRLRYEMLPYNYTLAWKNSITGLPLAGPMFVEYAEIPDTLMTQYMWGDDLLVSPVLKAGITSKEVYLPAGKWYEWGTNTAERGERWLPVEVKKNSIPVFVKEGSIIPLAPGLSSTSHYSDNEIELHYYPSAESSVSQQYFDDGKTRNAYEKGAFRLVEIVAQPAAEKLAFQFNEKGNGYETTQEEHVRRLIIHSDRQPTQVLLNNESVQFEIKEGQVSVNVPFTGNFDVVVDY